ncbi:MAG: carbohydrate ABC transporter permease [Christensenellales bacterium]|jgi:putative aldouronate transport system permease protein
MAIRKTVGERIFIVINTVFMTLLMLVTLYPVWHVAVASFSIPSQVLAHRGLFLWPKGLTLETYQFLFKHPLLLTSYGNTIYYVLFGTAINLIMTFHASYVMAKRNLYFKKYIMFFIVLTMFISGGLIPSFLLIQSLGMYDTVWAIVLPGAISTYNMIMMRTYFMGLPIDLEESAKIDGAKELTILYRIVLPLSAPIIAVIALYYGVAHWNSWFREMIYLRSRSRYPLQSVLREILILGQMSSLQEETDAYVYRSIEATVKYATIMVATVPILCVYPFLQKYFAKGVLIGALKG